MHTQRHTDPSQLIHKANETTTVKKKKENKNGTTANRRLMTAAKTSFRNPQYGEIEGKQGKEKYKCTDPTFHTQKGNRVSAQFYFESSKTKTARGSPYPRSTINGPSAAGPRPNPIGRWLAHHFRADDSAAGVALVKLRPRERKRTDSEDATRRGH